MNRIITDQRKILAEEVSAKPPAPQIFMPYKEVLDLYNAGVRVPEDMTLVWPDDNHGNMRQMPTACGAAPAAAATGSTTTSPTGAARRATCGWTPPRSARSGRSCAAPTNTASTACG